MCEPTAEAFGLLRRPARQRIRQERGEAFGILLPDQLRSEIERLLGLAHVAGLIGLARLIDGFDHFVGGARRQDGKSQHRGSGKHANGSHGSPP